MTPRFKHLHAFKATFEFPNEVFSSSVLCVLFQSRSPLVLCVNTTYPHAWRPETPLAYVVAMVTARCTETCFHAVLHPQGECWESGGSAVEETETGD